MSNKCRKTFLVLHLIPYFIAFKTWKYLASNETFYFQSKTIWRCLPVIIVKISGVGTLSPIFGPNFIFCETITIVLKILSNNRLLIIQYFFLYTFRYFDKMKGYIWLFWLEFNIFGKNTQFLEVFCSKKIWSHKNFTKIF